MRNSTLEFIGMCFSLVFMVGLILLFITAAVAPSLALAYFLFKLTGVM